MTLFSILKLCAKLPRKEALFQLNRVSMRDTLVYLFLLFFISFLPNVIINILTFEADESLLSYTQFLLQVIVSYPFLMMFLVITSISLLALIALIFRTLLQRKLAYQQLWKMTGFALLFPLICYHILFFTPLPDSIAVIISLIWLYVLLYQMIIIFPKKKVRREM
ncbi:hypothetical protein SAMN04487944_1085 [Gracilibacillus ureilyticus]|uniref:DUF1189 domain-containing protein n=1 Tax=Gracilibacillus ureilyticus TaxID=531814 RepID=A0A1H9R3A7_9BACI|nr:hypothetical protein [Gracilibacillus ureilyticus]SER67224.1 hypothetical protein SAMN04487944_1085 [Gracilibacillus ureilyticus]